MIVCRNCKQVFEYVDQLDCVMESRGEYFGFPSYEKVYICPDCRCDDFEEVDDYDKDDCGELER